ncbi:MAG: hypothetical protein E6J52_10425, partial [Chloroflexi bacterium]
MPSARVSPEERLEHAAEGEEERDAVELASLDGATIIEAATGEPEEAVATPSIAIDAERLADAQIVTTKEETWPERGVDLEVDAARGLRLKNPVLTASGTFGQGIEYAELIDVSRLGAIVNKGTTRNPRPGNPQYRIAETPAGILNSIG